MDTTKNKGPGRKRQNPELTSNEIKSLAKDYLQKSITKVIKETEPKSRKDAVITGYIRVIKKLPYILMEKTAPRNMYRRKLLKEYSVAF